ncbi:MAG TPA: MFS transporter [Pseudorhodoplanes sp.]|nr:MFS transporter [Pseudorhodoplanes sp.]
MNAGHSSSSPLDSTYSWLRLATALFMSTVGSVAMWSVVVVLPTVQAEFGTPRADASLPFTMTMMGFAVGNVGMGWLADRFGIVRPLMLGACSIAAGYIAAALAPNIWMFALAHLLTGFGVASLFGPLIADCSHWFLRWRGFAVAVAASGNYLAGAVWPMITQKAMLTYGWRETHIALGIMCLCIIVPLSLAFRRRLSAHETAAATTRAADAQTESGVPLPVLHVLLSIAAFLCCVAMATPQAHLVAYCGDLGYGVAAGAEMLTLMLGFGVISRLASGLIADKIGGLMTLLVGSMMQAVALALYFSFDGLTSLYIISILFGLFQGGIVPSYAIIVREYFPPQEAAVRVGIVFAVSVVGMAFGGWAAGWIFDLTASYRAAFAAGFVANLFNLAIAAWLLLRLPKPRMAYA